jgi:hypothetical protein
MILFYKTIFGLVFGRRFLSPEFLACQNKAPGAYTASCVTIVRHGTLSVKPVFLLALRRGGDDVVNNAVFLGFGGGQPLVTLHILMNLGWFLAGILGHDFF